MPTKALDAKLEARDFSDPDVLDVLAAMDVDQLIRELGEPMTHTEYAKAEGWKVGDGRPTAPEGKRPLASDDPAVMQSIARCAAARTRRRLPIALFLDNVHPTTCDWCDYPLPELLRACAWSVHQSGYIVGDVLIWEGKDHSLYSRSTGTTGYQNREYRTFWDLPVKERERRIEAASGRNPVGSLIEGAGR